MRGFIFYSVDAGMRSGAFHRAVFDDLIAISTSSSKRVDFSSAQGAAEDVLLRPYQIIMGV